MGEFTILDGVVITVISILVVFLVLIGLQIVMGILRILLKKRKVNQIGESNFQVHSPLSSETPERLEEDEETRTVAALTALILANQDQQDKKYHITSIKRIR